MRLIQSLPILLCAGLVACGGATAPSATTPPPTTAPPARGSLIGSASAVPVKVVGAVGVTTVDPQLFSVLLNAAELGTTAIIGQPTCSISIYTAKYNTVGGSGEATDASTAIMVPSGSDPACSGPRPVLLYAHGTTVEKAFSMSNLTGYSEPRLVAAMFAAQGFVVVAPNYAGYDTSSLTYHPYFFNATQQANDMIDALRAARHAFGAIGANVSARLFLSGYSQGGFVALATQRAMQTQYASEFNVTAAAPMSGPYALEQFGDTIFGGSPGMSVTEFLPLLTTAGQKIGADLYTLASDLYEAPYATGIETLLPGPLTSDQLISEGKLPASALFAADSLPQGVGAGAFFGAGNLVKTSYRNAVLADLAANPCNLTAGDPLNCSPQHPLRKLTLQNDLRTYLPTVPLLLCGGHNDPTVAFANTDSASSYFTAHGATAKLLTVVDLDDFPLPGDPYQSAKLGFAEAKLALIADASAKGESTADAVANNYHAALVPPYCIEAARSFFQSLLP